MPKINGANFWRVCPKCGQSWSDEPKWIKDTLLVGKQKRNLDFSTPSGRYSVILKIREHHKCGGEMLSP